MKIKREDIDTINSNWNLIKGLWRRILNRLSGGALYEQTEYNAAVTRTLNTYREELLKMKGVVDEIKAEIVSEREERQEAIGKMFESVKRAQEEGIRQLTDEIKAEIVSEREERQEAIGKVFESVKRAQEEGIRQLTDEIKVEHSEIEGLKRLVMNLDRSIVKLNSSILEVNSKNTMKKRLAKVLQKKKLDFDYRAFEDRFRGGENLIKERQKEYLNIFNGKKMVLDIGCGRGEFLELLKGKGIKGMGIDTNADMIATCKQKGLDVVKADALEYLASIKNGSVDGIFMAQVIEHLTLDYINELFNLLYLKLKKQGILVVETINPHCPDAMEWFYLDPTHMKPILPEFLSFLYESKGFKGSKVRYTTASLRVKEYEPEEKRLPQNYGDYAIIGVKP